MGKSQRGSPKDHNRLSHKSEPVTLGFITEADEVIEVPED
jgi:hypothetical protein